MNFTERILERHRLRSKQDAKEATSQASVPLKEVHHNTVTTVASTSVDFRKHSGNNKVTIETTVTMRKMPKRTSDTTKEVISSSNDDNETTCTEDENESTDEKENNTSFQDTNCPLRQDTKSRLQRLGVLYSDDPTRLSSPIHRTEEKFAVQEDKPTVKNANSTARSARLAALADTINHWEDDIKPHNAYEEAQGFARTESKNKIVYDYNDEDRPPSPSKPSPATVRARLDLPLDKSPTRRHSPVKPVSPVKATSPIKGVSPIKERYNSPIQMGVKAKEKSLPEVQDEDSPVPTMGVKQLRSPRKNVPTGSVLDRAQRYEESTSPPKRTRDPAELPLAERLALFERNAGGAVLPKAPFAMPVPVNKLQPQTSGKAQTWRNGTLNRDRLPHPQSTSHHTSDSTGSLHDRLAVFQTGANNSSKDHMKDILCERQKEIEMLKHRWDRFKGTDSKAEDFKPSAPPPSPPPLPSPPQQFEYGSSKYDNYCYDDEEEGEEEENLNHHREPPRQEPPEKTYPVLKDVKKFKLSPPKPGRIYPCLSDMETESEVQESEMDDQDNNRSSSTSTSNESDINSLGQDIVNLSRSTLKRDWSRSDYSDNEDMDNELDDFLEEALNESSDEPTPPKRTSYSKNIGSIRSTSFEYSQSVQERAEPTQQPLLHTVSFYRKQQNMTTKPTSPSRHIQIDPTAYSTDDSIERMEEELDRELKLVEQKIDKLREVVQLQQTYISQASQALNLCYSTIEFSGSTEQIEAEKLLLLATQRRLAAQHEIQRLRVEQTLRPKAPGNKNLTERGSLTLSNITLPLKMDVIQHAAKDDLCFHILCLVHSDERVLSTDVICAPRSLHSHNKLTFPNVLVLDGLYSDFKVTLEVYTMTAPIKELIPHDVKYHINTNRKDASKLKLTPRKCKGDSRLLKPPIQSPGGPSAVRSSAFMRAGYVIFSLREIQRRQFTLNKNAYTSVLEGSMHLKIESEMSMDIEYRGFLTMFEDVSGFGAWHRRWCLLKGDKLSYWKYPDDERKKIPLDTVELSSCTTQEVDAVPRDVCARANTFILETTRPTRNTDVTSLVLFINGGKTTIRHLLSADTKDERIQWCQHLNKALALLRAWGAPTEK